MPPAGDAPYCTPELYKECADPALGKEPNLNQTWLNPGFIYLKTWVYLGPQDNVAQSKN